MHGGRSDPIDHEIEIEIASIIRENHVHVPLNPFAHVRAAILCFAQANVIMYRCDILLHVHAYRYNIINWTTSAVTTTSL